MTMRTAGMTWAACDLRMEYWFDDSDSAFIACGMIDYELARPEEIPAGAMYNLYGTAQQTACEID